MKTKLISIFDFLDHGGNIILDEQAYTKEGVNIGMIKSFNNYSTELTNGTVGSNDYIHIKIKQKK